ncbi:MAG: efflux RND transporter periplasmic adaptor subunit [Proteobacteria bacterium]|nr:efflux RND transporter periplasmic adaptor subunit [Pseudomonadota bacterium]MDE3207709.1 efflux RND transporter periplasmic adaptor subunit [Pseudomonadota bacterium]
MNKRLVAIALLIILVAGLVWHFHSKNLMGKKAVHAMPPVTVSTAVAKLDQFSPEIHVVGSLQAIKGVTVASQMSGNITRIGFRSGQKVSEGKLLVQVDDSTELAQLHSDEAKLDLTRVQYRRSKALYVRHAVARSDLDIAKANLRSAKAAVESDYSVLNKLAVRAPFTGKAGIRQVSLGQYVTPGTAIVSLQEWNPLHLEFTVPQSDMSKVHDGQKVDFKVESFPNKVFQGKITALDSQIEATTRNLMVEAILSNSDYALRPGMFGNVTLYLKHGGSVLMVPNTAISYNTYGDYVYLVEKDKKSGQLIAHQQSVKVGEERSGQVVILSGLKPGQIVVSAGEIKLHNGSTIVVNNSIQP